MNNYLMKKIEDLENTKIALENALKESYNDLKYGYTDRITTLKLNDAVCDFYNEAIQIVGEISDAYYSKWKN